MIIISIFDGNYSQIVQKRKGDSGDPFVAITELVVINLGVGVLREIPDKASGMTILNGSTPLSINDATINQLPSGNIVSVQWDQCYIYADSSLEGATLNVSYFGAGNIYLSSNRIFTKNSDNTVTQTLADVVQIATQFVFLGAYSNSTTYSQYNVVSYQGASYVCTATTSLGNLPTDTSHFTKVSGNIFRNTYSSGVTYAAGDYVMNETGDILYVSIVDGNIGNALTSTTKWLPTISVASVTAAEASRVSAESSRVSAESGRVTAETGRVNAESSRVSVESNRVSAESGRVSAESTRSGNESTRQSNEASRIAHDAAYTLLEAYNNSHSYVPLNKVTYNGSLYQCISASVGNLPTNSTYWLLIASAGTVTSISSPNGDLIITNPTTTPSIQANTGNGASQIVKRDLSGNIVTNVTDAEIGYLDGVTSPIQTQLNATNQITTKSANSTLLTTEVGIINVTVSASIINITLPSAATSGLRYTIRIVDNGTGQVTLLTTSSQLINGLSTRTLAGQYSSITLLSDGMGWDILNVDNPNDAIQTSNLVHGLQQIVASQAEPLIPTFYGRTLVNILGKDGNCESLTPWTTHGGTIALSTTQFKDGTQSIKTTASAADVYFYEDSVYPLDTAKNYVFACWVYIESWTSGTPGLVISANGSNFAKYNTYVSTTSIGAWQLCVVKIPTSNTLGGTGFRVRPVNGGTTAVVYFDSIRLYELSAADYAAIGTTYTTDAAIDAFIPYVDGVKHVMYPAVTKYGKNLFDDQIEIGSISIGTGLTTANTAHARRINFTDALPSTAYTMQVPAGYVIRYVYYYDSNQNFISYIGAIGTSLTTFTTPSNTRYLKAIFTNTGVTTLSDSDLVAIRLGLQLELGSTATAFEAYNVDYLYGITDSLGNPLKLGSDVSRTVYDSVRVENGVATLTKRWMKDVEISGSLAYTFSSDGVGYKLAYIGNFLSTSGLTVTSNLVKPNGQPINQNSNITFTVGDRYVLGYANTSLYLTILDTDTGFDNAYICTVNEIKSYFYGWRVNGYTTGTTATDEASGSVAAAGTYALTHAGKYKSVTITKSSDNVTFTAATEGTDYTINYNLTNALLTNSTAGALYYKITYTYGVVANSWVSVVDGTTAPGTNTIAFVSANQAVGYTPYSLSYQLAVSTEEIVNVEGSIGLQSGGNQVEVLEGLIDREVTNPLLNGVNYYINTNAGGFETTLFKNRVNKIIAIYKNGVKDNKWIVDSSAAYGNQRAYIPQSNFDPTAVYTVTYEALDKYLMSGNVVSVDVSYQSNPSMTINSLVKRASDDETAISIINNRLISTFIKGVGERIQKGSTSIVIATLGTAVTKTITFPIAYAVTPNVRLTITSSSVGTAGYNNVQAENPTTTGFTLRGNSYVAQTLSVNWTAIG